MDQREIPEKISTHVTPSEESTAGSSVGAFEAKTHLSALLERAHRGGEIVITHRGKPYAKLTSMGRSHDVEAALAAAEGIQKTVNSDRQ